MLIEYSLEFLAPHIFFNKKVYSHNHQHPAAEPTLTSTCFFSTLMWQTSCRCLADGVLFPVCEWEVLFEDQLKRLWQKPSEPLARNLLDIWVLFRNSKWGGQGSCASWMGAAPAIGHCCCPSLLVNCSVFRCDLGARWEELVWFLWIWRSTTNRSRQNSL